MKRTLLFCLAFIAIIAFTKAQTATVATGLSAPIGITMYNGHLFVAEVGTGNNDGKISMIDSMGMPHTVVHGLPSEMDTSTLEVLGPWRPYVWNDILWVIVGRGSDSLAGSIMQFDLTSVNLGTDSITISDTVNTIMIQPWVLSQGFEESNVYSAVWDSSGNIYAADAGANAILKIDSAENISILDTFPAITNIFTPFPPTIDYVPTKLISDMNGGFYLCNLTGFPFVPGISEVKMIDTMGTVTTGFTGLSQAVDMILDSAQNLYVLQFGSFDSTGTPVMGSASIMRIMPSGQMDTLASGFGPAAGFTRDSSDGFYVTELMSGNVLHISNTTVGVNTSVATLKNLVCYPNPYRDNFNVFFTLSENSPVAYSITDHSGRRIFYENAGYNLSGQHKITFDGNSFASGYYYFTLTTNKISQTIPLIKY